MPVMQGRQDNKNMTVCEVCGAFLVANDAEQRIQAHLDGKQHLGFAKVRATIAELTVRTQHREHI